MIGRTDGLNGYITTFNYWPLTAGISVVDRHFTFILKDFRVMLAIRNACYRIPINAKAFGDFGH